MITADIIVVAGACLLAVLGAALGFGRCLVIMNKGIIGKLITLIISYFVFGIVITLDKTRQAQNTFIDYLKAQDNVFCNFLVTIHLETIITAVIVFIVVMILQRIAVAIISSLLSLGRGFRFFSSVLGLALGVATTVALTLIILEAVYLFGGGAESELLAALNGSYFGLDKIYLDNPLSAVFRL